MQHGLAWLQRSGEDMTWTYREWGSPQQLLVGAGSPGQLQPWWVGSALGTPVSPVLTCPSSPQGQPRAIPRD